MLKGIEESAAFILFLSLGVLQRPYCQMEIRHALALKKPIVLLVSKRQNQRYKKEKLSDPLCFFPSPSLHSARPA